MHIPPMSPQGITTTEASELPLTSNDITVVGHCSNSMYRGLVSAKVFLFGESCGAAWNCTVMWLNVGFHVATNTFL